jgi:hypothetical protein
MTNQIIPYGGSVEISDDGSTFVEIPECKAVPVPTTSTEYPEVTSLDSPGGFREFIAGLKDAGELSFQAGYTSAGYALLTGFDGVLLYWRSTFPRSPSQTVSGDVFTFRGYVTPAIDANDVGVPVNLDINVRISGQPGYAEGS